MYWICPSIRAIKYCCRRPLFSMVAGNGGCFGGGGGCSRFGHGHNVFTLGTILQVDSPMVGNIWEILTSVTHASRLRKILLMESVT